MTTLSQLRTLRAEIDVLKKALAAAQEPEDLVFLRQRLGDLDKKEIFLLEEQNRLQGQVSVTRPSEHCLPCKLLPPLG